MTHLYEYRHTQVIAKPCRMYGYQGVPRRPSPITVLTSEMAIFTEGRIVSLPTLASYCLDSCGKVLRQSVRAWMAPSIVLQLPQNKDFHLAYRLFVFDASPVR